MKRFIGALFFLLTFTIFCTTFTTVPASFLQMEALNYKAVFQSEVQSAGLLGIPTNYQGNPPPSNPDDWMVIDDDLLLPEDIWGNAVAPINVFKTETGVGMIYSSMWSGAVRGSLASSSDGIHWQDFPLNPVMDNFQPWQYVWRVSPGAVLWDGEKFICYYTDAEPAWDKGYYGMRAVGYAWSKDMVEWHYKKDKPLLTHNDFHVMYSDLIDFENSTPKVHGRIYPRNAFKYNGETYLVLTISVSNQRSSAEYEWVVIKSRDGKSNWERVDFKGRIPEDPIVKYGDHYYTSFKIYGKEGRGATIAVSDDILGPYENIYDGPLFTTGLNGNHRETVLWMYDNIWYICLGIRESEDVHARYGEKARIMKCAQSRNNENI
ncbi:hypothetical protein [Rhodohalobacter sp. 614A]|uniref:hypothetical protein n=1 Tax=Rhodohalobacter sp. 614A TaxID=2908649 RepID=UPI001F32BB24|nr:hypothetical protein [Rhodohalobacter sp. 614A]